jgi:hypothetical protein
LKNLFSIVNGSRLDQPHNDAFGALACGTTTDAVAIMKEPGLDDRHRDKDPPKAGQIQQKRSDTLNKNLSRPIPQFSPDTTLGEMRQVTEKVSEEAVRAAPTLSGRLHTPRESQE